MELSTLETIVMRAFEAADNQVTFAFQGGEPTLRGLGFYQTFIEYVAQYNRKNCKVLYTIQTNGIALDREWIQFFKKYNFLVGLSFDGIPEVHNRYRIDRKGNGSYAILEAVIRELQEQKVDFNVLMVVTKFLVKQVKETYQHMKKMRISFLAANGISLAKGRIYKLLL